jgi:hypothetical protein
LQNFQAYELLNSNEIILNIDCIALYYEIGEKSEELNHPIRFNDLVRVINHHSELTDSKEYESELGDFTDMEGADLGSF